MILKVHCNLNRVKSGFESWSF